MGVKRIEGKHEVQKPAHHFLEDRGRLRLLTMHDCTYALLPSLIPLIDLSSSFDDYSAWTLSSCRAY